MSAAEVRMCQWEGVAKGRDPGDLFDELYEADAKEAGDMAGIIREAIEVVQASREDDEDDEAFAEDWDRYLLGDDFDILQDHDIGNK